MGTQITASPGLGPDRAVVVRIEPFGLDPSGFHRMTPSRLPALRALLALQGVG